MVPIRIDSFSRPLHSTIFVLTHAHSDHTSNLSKKFKYRVHCSPITKHLMNISHPDVQFVDDLIYNAWTCLDDQVMVFAFDSIHCVGGIGLYCPDFNLLHFGDGRPSVRTIEKILNFHRQFVDTKVPLEVLCDVFVHKTVTDFQIDLPENLTFPTLRESRNLLRATLSHYNVPIKILVTHFGALSCLPRDFGYIWVHDNNVSSNSQRSCQEAFKLFNFQPGLIEVAHARIYKKKHYSDYATNDTPIIIILSANWFFKNFSVSNFNTAVLDNKGFLRIFVCAHASEAELESNYQGMCVGKMNQDI